MADEASTTLKDMMGKVNNFDEPMPLVNTKASICGIVITFLILSWLCGLMRLYTRFFIIHAPGWDDFFIALYLFNNLLGSTMVLFMQKNGMGQHFLTLPRETMKKYFWCFYLCNASYIMATSLVKISLLLQYLRIYESGRMRLLCKITIAFVSVWGIAYTFIAWYPCQPIHAFWEMNPAGKCWGYGSLQVRSFTNTFLSHSAMNMVLDLVVFAIPTPLYFTNDTPKRSRIGLLALLCMGAVVVLISIWRLETLIRHRATTWPTFDPSWYSPISIILSCAEIDIASICASAPVFWPVLRAHFNKIIFVTNEIKIEHEDRNTDEFELHRNNSSTDNVVVVGGEIRTTRHVTSPQGSEVRLADAIYDGVRIPVFSKHSSLSIKGDEEMNLTVEREKKRSRLGSGMRTRDTLGHYENWFVKEAVDPFCAQKMETTVEVQTQCRSERQKKQQQQQLRRVGNKVSNLFPKFLDK